MNHDPLPLVSVVMSVYNAEEYLAEAIDSILKQEFTDFEFIIINDGSTDNSFSIIDEFKSLDKRIIFISRENKGLIASLNEGICLAKGWFIARMDADDISLPGRLKEQVTFLINNPNVGICGSWAEVFGDNIPQRLMKHPASTKELKPKLLFSVCFAHPTVLLRKNVLDNFSLKYSEDAHSVEDYELWTRLIKHTEVANIQKVLLRYRYVETSVSRIADLEPFGKRYEQIKKIFSNELKMLNIDNTESENKLHFIVASNERLKTFDVNISELNDYFNKIILSNSRLNYYDQIELLKLLSKKFLIASYYNKKNNLWSVVSSKYFYKGLSDLLNLLP